MKTAIVFCGAAILLLATIQSRADIIAGPITNPANGHDYYLLTPNNWTASETEAENLGGTLAIVRNAAEQEWVFSKFGAYGGTNRTMWIGFRRQRPGGLFVSVTSEKMGYSNWASGQPDNSGNVENCVQMWADGTWDGKGLWNDMTENTLCYGLVEVPGKSDEKALTEMEKNLIGIWYHNGDPGQPCWIAATDNLLFAVNNENQDASRIIFTAEGLLFSPKWKQRAEIVQDKILWSNGVWWSRKPMGYQMEEAPGSAIIN
jgi:hypothetical protein